MFRGNYDNITPHRIMVNDWYRTSKYEESISKCIREGDTVIDYGAGSGILSFMAIKYGAKKVYAIERNYKTARFLRHNIKKANLEDKIEVFVGDAASFIYKNDIVKIDVVISECIGDHLFENKMIYEFYNLCDHYRVGRQIPDNMSLCMFPHLIGLKNNTRHEFVDFDSDIISEFPIDVAYFENNSDEKEFYYKLNHKIRHHDENVLFKLSWKYDLNDGLLEKKVKGFGKKGFIMLYFYVELFDKVFFTNHPSRPKTGTHSYFQRIVPYYEGDINIKINSLYDQRGNEGSPCQNIVL